jgi:hypothetical protein
MIGVGAEWYCVTEDDGCLSAKTSSGQWEFPLATPSSEQ